jgi:uncharacterized RDD family membrane protein YckC
LLARRGESGGVAYDGGLVYGTWAVTIVLAVWSAIACSSDLGSRPLGLHVGLVVLRILGFLLGVAAYVVVIIAASGDWRRTGSRSLEVLVAGHIVWLYSGVMESSFTRGTLGKMMLGMIVTDAEGGRISFVTAVGRAFGRFVAAPLFFLIDMTERQQGSTT